MSSQMLPRRISSTNRSRRDATTPHGLHDDER
jgi:hypothetical protein